MTNLDELKKIKNSVDMTLKYVQAFSSQKYILTKRIQDGEKLGREDNENFRSAVASSYSYSLQTEKLYQKAIEILMRKNVKDNAAKKYLKMTEEGLLGLEKINKILKQEFNAIRKGNFPGYLKTYEEEKSMNDANITKYKPILNFFKIILPRKTIITGTILFLMFLGALTNTYSKDQVRQMESTEQVDENRTFRLKKSSANAYILISLTNMYVDRLKIRNAVYDFLNTHPEAYMLLTNGAESVNNRSTSTDNILKQRLFSYTPDAPHMTYFLKIILDQVKSDENLDNHIIHTIISIEEYETIARNEESFIKAIKKQGINKDNLILYVLTNQKLAPNISIKTYVIN